MKYTEAISSLISKGLNEINHSDKGHLSLSTRRAILQAINDPLAIGRISILCALKVYPIWNEFFKDDTEIIGLIKNTEKFLLGQTDKNELLSNADHLDVFADNYMEDNITASFAAKVAVQAAYDVGSDADMVISDYDSDEEIEDPDEWDTAFLASLVYNGGIVDWDSIDDYRLHQNCLCGWQAAIPCFRKQSNITCKIHSLSYTITSLERRCEMLCLYKWHQRSFSKNGGFCPME